MTPREPVVLKRAVDAITIPDGGSVTLPAGSTVVVTQALGGTFTVQTDLGVLARIAGRDSDALGLEPPAAPAVPTGPVDPAELEKRVWDQLRTCYDPEIPVNIVDLGLVYEMKVVPGEAGAGHDVHVKMTLTAPGCGMGDILRTDAQAKIAGLPGVRTAAVEVVFEPIWHQGMMTEAARLQLGMM